MTKNLTISMQDELWSEMEKLKEVNWSQIARERFQQYLQERKQPEFADILERMRKEKGEEYVNGSEFAKSLSKELSYKQLSLVRQEYNRLFNLEWDAAVRDADQYGYPEEQVSLSESTLNRAMYQAVKTKLPNTLEENSESFQLGFGKTLLQLSNLVDKATA